MKHILKMSMSAAFMMAALSVASASETIVKMARATGDGTGDAIGTIKLVDSDSGVTLMLNLRNLPPGPHGFHLHDNANCGPTLLNGVRIPAGAAGGHFDPDHTDHHAGPEGDGHMGDLPLIIVAADGMAMQTLTAPRLKSVDALKGHALIIHSGGDNYSDSPMLLGGGGGRIACGIIG